MKLEKWHFNVLFVLAVIGALAMLFGPEFGLEVRPEVAGVFGLIIAFILKQRDDVVGEHRPEAKQSPDSRPDDDPIKENRHG